MARTSHAQLKRRKARRRERTSSALGGVELKNIPLWLWLALGGGALMLFAFRKNLADITGVAQQAFDNPSTFAASLPSEARPYADLILQVASEKGIDPYLIAAVGQQESRWGRALSPTGPAGTGDFTARTWTATPMPPDGKGWGRGLMQLDFNVYGNGVNWADPGTNVRLGADHILDSVRFFTSQPTKPVSIVGGAATRRGIGPGEFTDPRPLDGEPLLRAVVAAYNTGDSNVLMNLASGKSPDFTTSGGNYAGNALSNVLAWAQRLLA